jgi:hypothetical protein
MGWATFSVISSETHLVTLAVLLSHVGRLQRIFIARQSCHSSHESCVSQPQLYKGRLACRVTRLGEFSPIGRLFTLGCSLKINKVAQIIWLLFPWLRFCLGFDTTWVGLCTFRTFFHMLLGSPCSHVIAWGTCLKSSCVGLQCQKQKDCWRDKKTFPMLIILIHYVVFLYGSYLKKIMSTKTTQIWLQKTICVYMKLYKCTWNYMSVYETKCVNIRLYLCIKQYVSTKTICVYKNYMCLQKLYVSTKTICVYKNHMTLQNLVWVHKPYDSTKPYVSTKTYICAYTNHTCAQKHVRTYKKMYV